MLTFMSPVARSRTPSDTPWLVGCGSADITGEPWRVGMMGYGMRFQRSSGIQLRQRSRAFVLVDRVTNHRLVYVVADIGMFFRNVRDAVLAKLDATKYDEHNVVLTATHTHAGVAGYAGYRLYNMTTDGFRPRTFEAIVDGVVASIEQAEADLAPGRLMLTRGELHDASVNRSPAAFARNPESDRAHFPDAIDPSTTVLRLERHGRTIGVVNWFATHGTSLTNRNTMISGDNKGYAARQWESREPGLVAAFAQTNAGDMSPNVPDATQGPTNDEVENARIIGERQYDAAAALATETGIEIDGGLDSRLSDVNMSRLDVAAEFTGDGRPRRTGRAVLGAAFAAGTKEGPGARAFSEGVDGNRLLSACCAIPYRLRPHLSAAQRPKAMLIPVGALGWVADVFPIQLVRIGPLVLIALAQEVTIVAGLRLRRAVADVLDVPLDHVLVQGYANDYAGYVTTPEEYGAQRYEGGHTMFGRWELPAYMQEVTRLARELRDERHSDAARRVPATRQPRPSRRRNDDPYRCTGVLSQPRESSAPGDKVEADFAVTGDGGPLLPSYLLVEARQADGWTTVTTDGDGTATIEWRRIDGQSRAHATWHVPTEASGVFRFSYVDVNKRTSTREFSVGV
jgi:neutral ceramidase